MRRLVALLLLVTAFAGCSEGGPTETEPEIFQDIQEVEKDKGLIRGVVVDDTITPVEGAKVTANPGGLETTTDADGAFVFTDLEPSVYFLEATAKDHIKTQTSVDVKAGVEKPEIVRLMVAFNPPPQPYIQPLTTNMLMSYAVSANGAGLVVGPSSGESFFATLDLDPNSTFVHSELIWTADHPLADTMQMDIDYGSFEQRSISVRPVISGITQEDAEPQDRIEYTLFVEDSSLAPVGFTTEQKLVLYTFGFHGFVPDEGWSFDRDGAHPTP